MYYNHLLVLSIVGDQAFSVTDPTIRHNLPDKWTMRLQPWYWRPSVRFWFLFSSPFLAYRNCLFLTLSCSESNFHFTWTECFDAVGWVAGRASGL